jgi:DNA-binding GntR family transcriptional regulator
MSADQPTYRQIADDLRSKIRAGELPPGAQLPTQEQVASQWGVARMTARQAMAALVNEGLVSTQQGRGSTVREVRHMVYRPQAEHEPRTSAAMDRFMSALTRDGRKPTQSIEVAVVPATKVISERLGVDAGDPVVARKRIRSVDGRPFNINDTYYRFDHAERTSIMNPADIPRGSNYVLEDFGLKEVRAIDEFYIRMPEQDEVKRLELRSGTPVACHMATGYTVHDVAIRLDVFILPGDRHVILYERNHPIDEETAK